MTMRMILAMLAALVALATPAQAAELTYNGGFETNSLAGWTQGGTITSVYTAQQLGTVAPHSGMYQAAFGARELPGTISQVLNTVAGETYTVSFWLANLQTGIGNSVTVTFGDQPLLALVDVPAFGYTKYTLVGLANSAQTALTFALRNDNSFFLLDDVSVQGVAAVPEPASWALMLLGFGAVGTALRRRRARRGGRTARVVAY